MPELGTYLVTIVLRAQEEISNAVKKASESLNDLGKTSGKASSVLGELGKIATGVIGGLIGFNILRDVKDWVEDSVKAFARFEAAAVRLASLSAEAGQSIEGLSLAYRVMASSAAYQLAVTGEQAMAALESLVKAGLSGRDAMMALKDAIVLARLEGVDFSTAANNMVQVMAQFGITGDQARRVVDTLVNASRLGIGSANDFAQGLANVGATARAMGMSLEEATSWLVILERRVGSAREAGTMFNRFLLDLYEIAGKLGVPIRDMQGNLRNVNDIMLDVINTIKSSGMSFADMQERLQGVDVRALKALMTFSQMTENIQELNAEILRSGTSWEAYANYLETTAGKIARVEAENDRLMRRFGAQAGVLEELKLGFFKVADAVVTSWQGILGAVMGSKFDQYLAYIETHLRILGDVSEETAAQWLRGWVQAGDITAAEALKIADAVALSGEYIADLVERAVDAGVEVPDAFKGIAEQVKKTREEQEGLNKAMIDYEKAASIIKSVASAFHLEGEKVAEIINKMFGLNIAYDKHADEVKKLMDALGLTEDQARQLIIALEQEAQAQESAKDKTKGHAESLEDLAKAMYDAASSVVNYGAVTGPLASNLGRLREAMDKVIEKGGEIPRALEDAFNYFSRLNEQLTGAERKMRGLGAASEIAGYGISYYNTMLSVNRALIIDELQAIDAEIEKRKEQLEAYQLQAQQSQRERELLAGAINQLKQEIAEWENRKRALLDSISLTSEQIATQERLKAVQDLLSFTTQQLSLMQTALQLAMMGAGDTANAFMSVIMALADAQSDGIVTEEEFKNILQLLGVQFDESGRPVMNFTSILQKFKDEVQANIEKVQGFRSELAKLDGMTVHTYHYHHEITVKEGGGGGFGAAPESRNVGAKPAQLGEWYAREGLYYLHRGEMVLPRNVAEWFRNYGPVAAQKNIHVNINVNAGGVADPNVLAEIVSRKLVQRLRAM